MNTNAKNVTRAAIGLVAGVMGILAAGAAATGNGRDAPPSTPCGAKSPRTTRPRGFSSCTTSAARRWGA